MSKENEILGQPGWSEGLDVETRNDNLKSKKEALQRYHYGRRKICKNDSRAQIFALQLAIEDVFKKNENEICKVKKIALDFVKNVDVDIFEVQNIYKVLQLQLCESWHALLIRIDTEFHEIAMSNGKSYRKGYFKGICGCHYLDQICPKYPERENSKTRT